MDRSERAPWFAVPVSRWVEGPDAPGGAARQARARTTRRTLLLAAARRFDAHGYQAAALRDILADTGLTKGALYFHFSSKHQLADQLVAETLASWRAIVDEVAARDLDPIRRLLVESDAAIARWMYDPLVRGARRALDEEALAPAQRSWHYDWACALEERLCEARERGLLQPGIDAPRAARLLQAVGAGHHALAEAMPGPPSLWARMTDTWRGVLPMMVVGEWVRSWKASGWQERPLPERDTYLRALAP